MRDKGREQENDELEKSTEKNIGKGKRWSGKKDHSAERELKESRTAYKEQQAGRMRLNVDYAKINEF